MHMDHRVIELSKIEYKKEAMITKHTDSCWHISKTVLVSIIRPPVSILYNRDIVHGCRGLILPYREDSCILLGVNTHKHNCPDKRLEIARSLNDSAHAYTITNV